MLKYLQYAPSKEGEEPIAHSHKPADADWWLVTGDWDRWPIPQFNSLKESHIMPPKVSFALNVFSYLI